MKTRTLGMLTLFAGIFNALWCVIFAISLAVTPPIITIADQIAEIENRFGFFTLIYAVSALFTLAAIMMLAGLYAYCQDENPLWTAISLVFIPIYGFGNLVVYLSQIFVVPHLIQMYHDPEIAVVADGLLRMTVHLWEESAIGFVNVFSYAILGIPSLIFGILMFRKNSDLRIGSAILSVSGVLSLIAFVGVAIGNSVLAFMSPLGGFVFMIASFGLSIRFFRTKPLPQMVQLASSHP